MDRKLRFFMSFAKMIRPGWRATALFYLLFIPVRFIAPRKKVAQKNIELVFPDKTDEEKRKCLMDLTGA